MEALAGPGDTDIEEAALLLDLLAGLCVADRHHALGDADQEDDVPLQSLGRVQRGEGDALHGRGVLGAGPLVEFGDEVGEGRARPGGGEVPGEVHQGGERLPALPDRARAGRRLRCPALARQHGAHLGGQVGGVVEKGVVAAEAGRSPQGDARLAHLGAVEEPLGATQLVGHPGVGEGLLVGLGLGVRAEQDGDLARRDPGVDQLTDAVRRPLGLRGLVGVLGEHRLGPRRTLGDEFQPVVGGAAGGLCEQAVGQTDDLGGRAVVTDQLDDGGSGMADAEVEQVVGGCARERVDGLTGVTDHAQVLPVAEPQLQQSLLERADVLVLVDHEVLVLGADLLRDVVPVLQDGDGQQQHVLEVDDGALALEVLVGGVQLGDLGGVAGRLPARLDGRRRVVGRDGLGDLRPLDLGGDVPQLAPVEPDAAGGGRVGDELDLAVDEPGHGATDRFRPEVLELAQRRRVEGTGLDADGAELAQPAAHLPGGAVGEGDGEHAGGLEDAGAHPVGDPVGDRPGLAGAGARQHAHRTVQGGGHRALLGVEPVEHRVGRVRYLREEGGVRCCCHTAMLPGRRGRVSRLSTGRASQSY
ncbi:hypothetical protein SGRIM128S_05982 [Streptomyces griseomycini]